MTDTAKELTLPEPVELTDTELDAVAAGCGEQGSERQCQERFVSGGDNVRIVGPAFHNPNCLGEG